ncbi:unnamed protein product [Heterosigma akashiwo]
MEVPYSSPISPSMYGLLALVLVSGGLTFMALFFIYQMKVKDPKEKSIIKELTMAVPSSLMLGLGTLFVFLWAGLYV